MNGKKFIGLLCAAVLLMSPLAAVSGQAEPLTVTVEGDMVTIQLPNEVQSVGGYYIEGPDGSLIMIDDEGIFYSSDECRTRMPAWAKSGTYHTFVKVRETGEVLSAAFSYQAADSAVEIDLHTPVSGTLGAGAADYYQLAVPQAGTYAVQTQSDIQLTWYDQQNVQIPQQADGSYALSAGTYRLKVTGAAGAYQFQVTWGAVQGGALEVSCQKDQVFVTAVTVQSIRKLAGKTIQITYDDSALQPVDLAAQTYAPDTAVGPVAGTDVTILSHRGGVITLQVSRDVPEGKALSGAVNLIQWSAKKEYTGVIEIAVL